MARLPDLMIELLTALNALTPLGLAALLALILWKTAGSHAQIRKIQENGFNGSGIPEMLRRIEATLARIEASLIRQEAGKP